MGYSDLNRNQRKVLQELLSEKGRTIKQIAARTGLSSRTIYNYLSCPIFQTALQKREGEVISVATRRLISLVRKSINCLEEILDSDEPYPVKRLAAKTVIDSMMNLRNLHSIEMRLARLEEELPQ